MKRSLIIIATILSFSTFAQTFKLQSSSNLADYKICQENHNRILNKLNTQVDSQIARMINGYYIEDNVGTADYKLEYYKEILNGLIVKKIFYQELLKQLNSYSMDPAGKMMNASGGHLLDPDKISIDLPTEYKKVLDSIVNAKNIKLAKDYLAELRNSLVKDVLLKLVSSRFRKIGAGIFARIALGEVGKIATGQVIKSAALHFGSEIFISAGTGILIDLVTFPLHGYRLPPETEWTNLLNDHPEIIIVPEWMNKAGIHDAPWMAHCYAIQRRTKLMEKALSNAILSDEVEFTANVRSVYELSNDPEKEDDLLYTQKNYAVSDNTYVAHPAVYQKSPGPVWLSKD